jgi:hypothetical protein
LRSKCFPPAPISIISSNDASLQKPLAGKLATEDTVTGSKEKHKGEAVEQEARSFMECISKVRLEPCSLYSTPHIILVGVLTNQAHGEH